MSNRFDAIVVGVGAMGSAACFELAKRGARVLGIEQFGVPNRLGSSHGVSRMIRAAYYEEPRYVPLLMRAYELWRELEAASGRKVLYQIGGIFLGPPEGMLVKNSVLAARAHGLAHEVLSVDDVRRRFKQFAIPDDWGGVWDPMAGFVLSEVAIETFAAQAKARGATILSGTAVRAWRADDRGVSVETDGGTFEADRLILTAGAWTSRVLGELDLGLTVTRQVLGWVQPRDARPFQLGEFPVWAIDSLDGGIYYGFPMIPEGPGLKVAHHLPGQVFDPAQPTREPRDSDEDDFRLALRKHLPRAADAKVAEIRICMYTNSRDHHFIIDTHPKFERVAVACGFSGHGFKFASVVGEVLARWVCEGVWDEGVKAFLGIER